MRILLVHNRYTQRGGEDIVFEAELNLLRQRGNEVFVWEEYNDRLVGQSQLKSAANTIWSFESQKTLEGLLQEYRPDVAHFHNTFLKISPAAYYTCQKAGVPVVQTLHNYRLACPAANFLRDGHVCEACLGKWGMWPSIRYGCWHASRPQTAVVAAMLTAHRWLGTWQKQVNVYITLTEFARQKFMDAGIPGDRIMVKPNFIASPPTLSFASSPRLPYALFVGRLSPEKGAELLVQAWQSLPDVSLRIVGDGPMRAELEEFVRQKGMTQIEFCGPRPQSEVLEMMQEARLLVVPSRAYEGLPTALLEAFSRHLPVIATRHGSMGEVVAHGETGLHFTPQEPSDLAYWVRWAWEHPEEMQGIAEKGFQEFKEKYSPETNYLRLMEIYQQAISHHNASSPLLI